jgi:hypothetical protein
MRLSIERRYHWDASVAARTAAASGDDNSFSLISATALR